MTLSKTALLGEVPAFAACSAAARARLEQAAERLEFRPGQPLSLAEIVGDRVLLIESGRARLLWRHRGRLLSLEQLGAGDLVGLASVLRAAGCEYVTASDAVTALALPVPLVLELFQAEPEFRCWCDTHLWTAELLPLLTTLIEATPRPGLDLEQALARARNDATLLPARREDIDGASGQVVYVASANAAEAPLATRLAPGAPLPAVQPPLPLRLIALPEALVASLHQPAAAAEPGLSTSQPGPEAATLQPAPAPTATAADLGGSDLRRELRLVRGDGPLEEVLACFQMLSQAMELPFRRDAVDKVVRDAQRRGQSPNLQLCGQLAAMLGLHAVGARVPASMGTRLQAPALVPWKEGFAVLVASNSAGMRLASPREGWVQLEPQAIEANFPEGIELVQVDRTIATPESNFGPAWFLPALKRHRGVLIQVLTASFVVQLFGLANPLLIQVIIDKVINQRSLDTLQVLGIALVVVTVLEGLLTSLRTFLFTDTTNRIDMRLGAEVIDHLLRLPLGYFDKRPVGELGTRIAELEKIRNFLTGQALTTVLDAVFSVIYIAVMLVYSWLLTLVALVVLPIQVGLTVLGAPLFRRQFRQAAQENAKTQSHLVEVLTGIQTVKAQNVEMVSRWKWQDLYSRYIARTFEKTVTGTALQQTSQVLQKLSQLLVLWIGAALVLKGEMTLGQLIAFRIISGYVTQPLLRLSTIWQNIQELRVSFERLADVVDTPQESDEKDKANIPLPPLQGRVSFEDVQFAFNASSTPVLKGINLDVPAGTFVGVVGQSGSGKSTMMKLLPRLYTPQQGRLCIDGYDITKVELYSLRRQVGIVPQDPLLFAGSVSDNIALTNPDASSEEITRAAQIACAHDFIMQLPSGYSTDVGERGANLSGGQRQRIAIARTLLGNPKLMVLDEATSALDYETERRVCDNLREALQGCTVFFITHRLSTIRRADRIVMLHQGAIVESGSHDELMALRGRYFALYRQQEAS